MSGRATDPYAPENLPKGMVPPSSDSRRVSLAEMNYTGKILDALKNVPEIDVKVHRLEVLEDEEVGSVVTLVLEVSRKE